MYLNARSIHDAAVSILDDELPHLSEMFLMAVTTQEGKVVAHRAMRPVDPDTVAIAAFAVLSVCDALATEGDMGLVASASFEASHGTVVAIRVGGENAYTLIAGSILRADASSVLYAVRDCAQKLKALPRFEHRPH